MANVGRIVVVGASLAGLRAAETLRSSGYDGIITVIGAEPHMPYDRPPLSKQFLKGDWDADRIGLRRADQYEPLQLEIRLGVAAIKLDSVGKTVTLADGEKVPFDGGIIATGTSARQLPFGHDLEGVHTLRTLDDAIGLREALDHGARLAIVGGGFIGSEVASTARGKGCEVDIFESAPVPLGRVLGPAMGAALGALHGLHGTRLHVNANITGFAHTAGNRVAGITLSDGTTVDADAILVGVGSQPVTGWLEGSGLTLRDGIVCDMMLHAIGAPGVFAAGDVCRWPDGRREGAEARLEHWTNATEQGAAAAKNLLAFLAGGVGEPFSSVPFVWSDQYGSRIQFLGHSAATDDVAVVRGNVVEGKFVAAYGRNGVLVGALGVNMPKDLMGFRKLLAADTPPKFSEVVYEG